MIRLAVRVLEEGGDGHIKISLLINGELVTGPCGITLRQSEIVDFIHRLQPDGIEVDREMISDHLFHRLAGFKNTRFV